MSEATELFCLDGRIAVVTGASRGIGGAIAKGFSNLGAQVFGFGRSDKPQDSNINFEYLSCDLSIESNVTNSLGNLLRTVGRLDILVNAAGITGAQDNGDYPMGSFRKTLDINLIAAFHCCCVAIPFMKHNGYGSIINVTSIGASLGFPGNPGYAASKGGLASLTRSLALDHGKDHIRVNSLVPGYIRTAMTQGSYMDLGKRQARTDRTILGRWAEPEELVGPAVFLASPASSFVTGTELFVDGGWTARGL